MTLARLAMYFKVVGQRSRSNAQNRDFTSLLHFFKVKSQGRVKGQGQRSWSNFWCAAVDIRGSALPRAVKGNNHHYQSKVIFRVSVISGRLPIIVWMQSIGF